MSTSNCSDNLSDVNLSVPMLPCSDLGNLDKWKQYCMDMNTLVSDPNFPRVVNQCVCKNGSECLKQNQCSNQIFNDPTLILANPTCLKCVLSQSSCQKYESDLNKLGCTMSNLFKTGPTITPVSLNDTVSKCCGFVPTWDNSTVASVTDILNNRTTFKSNNSSSTNLFKKYLWIWIIIVIAAVFVLVGGLVLMTKRGHLSRVAKKL